MLPYHATLGFLDNAAFSTEITSVGLFLFISTGGFPRCQKPHLRYFQHLVSFITAERNQVKKKPTLAFV